MPLSWNEIRTRATAFAHDWQHATDENADAKTFWDELFDVYGVKRRRVANFERRVTRSDGSRGFIDLLWRKVVLVEHKSRGKSLDRAHAQAKDYFPGIRDADLPRYIVVCDFARFRIFDLDTGDTSEFQLEDLPSQVQRLGFIAGYEQRIYREQDPVNARAADRLGELHDALKTVGYEGHALEVYLVRLLFCLFADDTGIFMPRGVFQDYIEQRTSEDGSDLGPRIQEFFETLNKPVEQRYRNLDEALAQFPYVNGELFSEPMPIAPFDARLRALLLEACEMDWGKISPAIFGSIFQSIKDVAERREGGEHYTSEQNILKSVGPLFIDELRAELESLGKQRSALHMFQQKLASLQFLDPACGCGNFLVIAYRELRELELGVIRRLYPKSEQQQLALDAISQYVLVDVNQFHGIEIEEWPAQIARVAMWLVDHQMNIRVSQEFGHAFVRIPLTKSANIVHANALELDWSTVVASDCCHYVLGNPPFRGARVMTKEQKASLQGAIGNVPGWKNLDLVAGWYIKTARYLSEEAKAALVSTNSITQGEQVGLLWSWMLDYGTHIHFAHRTFRWKNEAKRNAAVHCVIVGFARYEATTKRLFDYETPNAEPYEITARNINPYLIDHDDVLLPNRSKVLDPAASRMDFGSMANDGQWLLLEDDERAAMLAEDPAAERFIRPFAQVDQHLYSSTRWCLWLKDVEPSSYRSIVPIMRRVAECRTHRAKSKRLATQALAQTPGLFGEIRQPPGNYLLVPRHTGIERQYIPLGFVDPHVINGDANLSVPNATLYDFGVMSSSMHMAWVRTVCGRIKSDFRYSVRIVYNNFPWPESVSSTIRRKIETAAEQVLDARQSHPDACLAELYDPLTMPADLLSAHRALDRAVQSAYTRRALRSDLERAGFLFTSYQRASALLEADTSKRRTRSKSPKPSASSPTTDASEE